MVSLQLSHCDDQVDWGYINAIGGNDGVDFQEGVASLTVDPNGVVWFGYATFNPVGAWDLSGYDRLRIWDKCDNIRACRFAIYTDAANWSYWEFNFPVAWEERDLLFSDLVLGGGVGVSLNNVGYFQIRVTFANNPDTAFFDDIRAFLPETSSYAPSAMKIMGRLL